MALYLESGWDTGAIGSLSFEVVEDTGSIKLNVTLDAGRYCHSDLSSVMGSGEYTDLATALGNELTTESAALGNVWTYAVTWTQSTGKYNIQADGNGFQINFDTDAEKRTALAMGFAAGNHGSATSHTSDVSSYYYIASTIGAASNKSDDYEDADYIEGAIAQDGSHYSISPTTLPVQNDFELHMETHAKTFKRKATAAVPWTYQHFFEHARAAEPFLIADGTDNTVHTLRPKGGSWKGNRVTQDYDGLWNVKFETYMEGRL